MCPPGSKSPKATCLAIHSRVPVFWPSLRGARANTWSWETPWGSVTVSAKLHALTGQHRRVLDALFAYALDSHHLDTGALVLLVDPYKVDQATSRVGTPRLRGMLDDIKHADVVVTEQNGLSWFGSIVSDWKEANISQPLPGGALVGSRPMWAVTISATWMRAHDSRTTIQYRNLLPALHSLRRGASYALALMVITHNEVSMKLEEALQHVMAIRPEMTSRGCRKVIAEVMSESETLAKLGIHIKEGTVLYRKHPDVRFSKQQAKVEPITPVAEPITPATEPITPGLVLNTPALQEYQRYSSGEGACCASPAPEN